MRLTVRPGEGKPNQKGSQEHVPERRGAWYADPYGEGQLRWYDGKRWTDQVRDAEAQGEPLAPPAQSSAPVGHDERQVDAATTPVGQSTERALAETRVRGTVDLAMLALIAAAYLVNLLVQSATARALVTLIAALLVPGAAVITRLPLSYLAHTAALVVGISLTIEAASSLAMVWIQWWHPVVAASILAGLAAIALGADCFRCALRSA